MTTVTNGVNVQALLDAREVLKGAPEAAQFTWRASAKWEGGVHSTIKVQSYFGLGEEQSHKEEWTFDADHPEVFAAEDNGITPIEYLLVGLASCLTGVSRPWRKTAASSCARSSRWSRAGTTSAGSSVPTATSATATTTSR